ncbi:hypothetical protein Bca4012_031081 [Brassica carinata]
MEALVVDAGSKLLKAGAAIPDQSPPMLIPSQMKRMVDNGDVSSSAVTVLEDVTLLDPIERGFIRDWDATEDLLSYVVYTGLGWEEGNEGNILFTDPLYTPKEQLVQLMFETFNVSGFYASEQAVLSLYGAGRISGCTVDIGHGKIAHCLGGTDLTKLFVQELGKSNPLVNLSMSDVETLKEQYASCAEDEIAYEKTQNCEIELHTLPDGQNDGPLVSSENHRQLLEYTVLCGGTTSMTGFEGRFQKEANLCSSAIRPMLVKPPEYMPESLGLYSAWVGGAILAKVVFPQNQHVTKADYDETGPSVEH